MTPSDETPFECRDLDLRKALEQLPPRFGELFLTTGEQRLQALDAAMDRGDLDGVMEAAHSLANLTGLLNIQALASYAREIYAAAEHGELAPAAGAHLRLRVVLRWAIGQVRAAEQAQGRAPADA